MNHADVKKHLADYLEGDLDLEHRAVVDAHLDQCGECAREVTEMQQTIRLLRLMPEPETPPMIAANVMRRIRAGESRPGLLQRLSIGLGSILEPSFVLPASAIAAAALVVMVVQEPREGGLAGLWSPADSVHADEVANDLDTRAGSPRSSLAASPLGGVAGLGTASGARPQPDALAGRRRVEINLTAEGPRRTRFADPVLVPQMNGLIPDAYVSNRVGSGVLAVPPSAFVSDRFSQGANGARAVSQRLAPRSPITISSGGGDARDAWLARGFEDPVDFARFISGKSLAEQELWIARLTERAEARGLLGELVQSLRATGDDAATWLAEDFSAERERARAASAGVGEPAQR